MAKGMTPHHACPIGYTRDEVEEIMGANLAAFDKYMRGQTGGICEGREFDHATRTYRASECASNPHGYVWYEVDVVRFIRGHRGALDC